ncbi:hypothetical protein ACFWWM_27105 [Streptomyces sp. NPDC058682]|uniref:hypothetical protein n=1 Tax=Streptomyces sp. NPDC058682 TaxID=3346596 RepID=UPI0036460C25
MPALRRPQQPRHRDSCDRCAVEDRLEALFHGLPPDAAAQLVPLRAAPVAAEHQRTVLAWLRNSASARILIGIAASCRLPTHADLDTIAASGRGAAQCAAHLRAVLVAFGTLPARDEHLAAIERHLTRTLVRHPEYTELLKPYVRWSVLPRARRRAARAVSTRGRARWAYARVNCAVAFLTHLHGLGLGLGLPDATQQHVDGWLAAGSGTRYELRDFLVWTARHGHSRELLVPHRGKAEPEGLGEDIHWDLLQRCLHDDALPLDVRAAGALLLLFGQHLTRIVTLTTGHLGTRNGHPTLRLDDTPMRLPGPLAAVLT